MIDGDFTLKKHFVEIEGGSRLTFYSTDEAGNANIFLERLLFLKYF